MPTPVRIITSFNPAIFGASGRFLMSSLRRHLGDISVLAYFEGAGRHGRNFSLANDYRSLNASGVTTIDVLSTPAFKEVKQLHADVIPAADGGSSTAAIGEGSNADWNQRWFQWFRKIAAQHDALSHHRSADPGLLIWMDSDLRVTSPFDGDDVESFLQAPIGIMQGTRPAAETGLIVFDERRAETAEMVGQIWSFYRDGNFRQLPRWDDGFVYGEFAKQHPTVFQDFAHSFQPIVHTNSNGHTTGNQILPVTPFGKWLEHDKGLHRRIGITGGGQERGKLLDRVVGLFRK